MNGVCLYKTLFGRATNRSLNEAHRAKVSVIKQARSVLIKMEFLYSIIQMNDHMNQTEKHAL